MDKAAIAALLKTMTSESEATLPGEEVDLEREAVEQLFQFIKDDDAAGFGSALKDYIQAVKD